MINIKKINLFLFLNFVFTAHAGEDFFRSPEQKSFEKSKISFNGSRKLSFDNSGNIDSRKRPVCSGVLCGWEDDELYNLGSTNESLSSSSSSSSLRPSTPLFTVSFDQNGSPVRLKKQKQNESTLLALGAVQADGPVNHLEENGPATPIMASNPTTPLVQMGSNSAVSTPHLKDSPGLGLWNSPVVVIAPQGSTKKSKDSAERLNNQLARDPEDVARISAILSSVDTTPQKTGENMARQVAKYAIKSMFVAPPDDYKKRNDTVLQALGSPQGTSLRNAADMFEMSARRISRRSLEVAQVTRVDHATTPTIVRGASGQIKAVSGGHDIDQYLPQDLVNSGFLVKGIFGTLVGKRNLDGSGGRKKTLQKGFDAQTVLSGVRSSSFVGSLGNTYFSRLKSDGSFVASHADSHDSLMLKSYFPVLVVLRQRVFGDCVKMGDVAIYDAPTGRFNKVSDVIVGKAEYDKIVQGGTPVIDFYGNASGLVDITDGIKPILAPLLGYDRIPPVYSYHDAYGVLGSSSSSSSSSSSPSLSLSSYETDSA